KKRSGLQLNHSFSLGADVCYVCPVETRYGSFKVFFSLNAASAELQEEISSRQAILEPRKIRVYASQLEAIYGRVKRIEQLERQLFTGPKARAQVRSEIKRVKRMIKQMKSEPLETLFGPAHKLVQEIAKDQGKEIQFITQGTWLYLDKSLLNHLYEPMLHLFRNAVDHGIEVPAERERKGKPPCGTIKTRAAFSENELRLIVSDDGVGFDYEKIREKAVMKGLLNERQSQNLLTEELAPFVFHSGLSTRESADSISGRGLGMDIVKRGLEAMGGEARVLSSTSFGTAIELLIPLSEDFSSLKSSVYLGGPTPAEDEDKHLLLDELSGYLNRLTLSLQAISK
ncbi:MAG: ATP-binding protein, partial [Deltaproteobacteria bacterium]